MSKSSQTSPKNEAVGGGLTGGRDLLVVSNREPYQHRYKDDGEGVVVDRPVGGLTASLDRVMQQTGGTWIAWGDGSADSGIVNAANCVEVPPENPKYTLKRVWLGEQEMCEYYYGFSNQVLWPLCHGLVGKAKFEGELWDRYRAVNEAFVDIIEERADSNTVVWFQDFHLALAPQMAREACPETTFVQFWHIPWPAWDIFSICPQRRELLEGLLGNDLLGFQAERYCEHFFECVEECLDGATVDHEAGTVYYDGRATDVAAFPMNVDADLIRRLSDEQTEESWDSFQRRYGIDPDTRIAVSVEQLDYTKGIPERLDAFEKFWEANPEWQGKLTYVQKASEEYSEMPAYQDLIQTVQGKVNHINDRFGTKDWQPVIYVDDLSQEELYGLYRRSDLGVVTPIRDGTDLVAKEYVAAQVDDEGVLLLSELADPDGQFGEDALVVEPHDTDEFAAAIAEALSLSEAERKRRMTALQETVRENDLDSWVHSMLGAI